MKRINLIGVAIIGFGVAFAPFAASAGSLSSADTVMLNPQPLPPKEKISMVSRFDAVMLNPQPLPPKVFKTTRFKSRQ